MTRRKLRGRGLSFRDAERTVQTLNLIANFKRLGFDEEKILDAFSSTNSVRDELNKMREECERVLSSLELFNAALRQKEKQWGDFARGVEDYGAAIQMGLQPAHLLAAAAIFHKHICNFTPDQILSDIENYGNLRAAAFKLKLDLDKSQTQGTLI